MSEPHPTPTCPLCHDSTPEGDVFTAAELHALLTGVQDALWAIADYLGVPTEEEEE